MSAIFTFSILCLTLTSSKLLVKAAIINSKEVIDVIGFSLTLFLYFPKIDSNVDALDYLLKPFSFAELSKAAGKARIQFELLQKTTEKLDSNDDYLFIKSEYKLIRINLNDIRYIEGMKEYVRIHLSGQKPLMTLLSMKSLEENCRTANLCGYTDPIS